MAGNAAAIVAPHRPPTDGALNASITGERLERGRHLGIRMEKNIHNITGASWPRLFFRRFD